MNQTIISKILKHLLLCNSIQLKVYGNSMYPVIHDSDLIIVEKSTNYTEGTIIVFRCNTDIKVHRLLRVDNNVFYCKGDNSFMIERINYDDIIGKVAKVKHNNFEFIPKCVSKDFLKMSYEIGSLFELKNYKKDEIIASSMYKSFYSKYLKE